MKTKYQKTVDKIIEANPSILELKFGCKIETKNEYDIPNIGRMNKVISEYNPDFDELKIDCGWYKKDRFKIIGRDITLEDCLLVIDKKHKTYPHIGIGSGHSEAILRLLSIWKPNIPLQDQSDKTKDFIGDLIAKK